MDRPEKGRGAALDRTEPGVFEDARRRPAGEGQKRFALQSQQRRDRLRPRLAGRRCDQAVGDPQRLLRLAARQRDFAPRPGRSPFPGVARYAGRRQHVGEDRLRTRRGTGEEMGEREIARPNTDPPGRAESAGERRAVSRCGTARSGASRATCVTPSMVCAPHRHCWWPISVAMRSPPPRGRGRRRIRRSRQGSGRARTPRRRARQATRAGGPVRRLLPAGPRIRRVG